MFGRSGRAAGTNYPILLHDGQSARYDGGPPKKTDGRERNRRSPRAPARGPPRRYLRRACRAARPQAPERVDSYGGHRPEMDNAGQLLETFSPAVRAKRTRCGAGETTALTSPPVSPPRHHLPLGWTGSTTAGAVRARYAGGRAGLGDQRIAFLAAYCGRWLKESLQPTGPRSAPRARCGGTQSNEGKNARANRSRIRGVKARGLLVPIAPARGGPHSRPSLPRRWC